MTHLAKDRGECAVEGDAGDALPVLELLEIVDAAAGREEAAEPRPGRWTVPRQGHPEPPEQASDPLFGPEEHIQSPVVLALAIHSTIASIVRIVYFSLVARSHLFLFPLMFHTES